MMKRARGLLNHESRHIRVLRRLFIAFRFAVVLLVASLFAPVSGQDGADPSSRPSAAPSATPAAPSEAVPPEVVEALRGLDIKGAMRTRDQGRLKFYGILEEKGDARIIPALNAFLAGELQLRDSRLMLYGDTQVSTVDGKEVKLRPLFDAITGEPVTGPDGKPIVEEVNLANAFGKPLTVPAREPVSDLIATLSLLHPDPEKRLASIRDAGERAIRVFPSRDTEDRVASAMAAFIAQARAAARPGTTRPATMPTGNHDADAALLAAIEATLAEKPAGILDAVPSEPSIRKVSSALATLIDADKAAGSNSTTLPAEVRKPAAARERLAQELKLYSDYLETLKKNREDLPKFASAFERQLKRDPSGPFAPALIEAQALADAALGDRTVEPSTAGKAAADTKLRIAAAQKLGEFGTLRAENVLRKLFDAAERTGDRELAAAVGPALEKAASYQQKVRLVQYTFAGLSTGSIYVLLALGLAVIFGLMGVINMAHGEFMMVGAFTTYAVATAFKENWPGAYDYFPIAAVPAAFLVAGLVGLLTETVIIRHLYGRTIDTLIATIGISLILVQVARVIFGDNLSYGAPGWMQGSMEVAPDLNLNRARFWTIVYCVLAIVVVYLVVNKTKLGLLLRATTQNRQMAAALGVPTRMVDALTFAFGAGLAGLAGVVVPMIDKINPSMGQDYVVSSFMVVVVGGVGKLAGAIIAGFGIGSIGNYLEPLLSSMKSFAATSSVFSKVIVLAMVVMFLQWRPSGLFPPKGRLADA